ncbi:hypothetical protein ACCO45_003707 [Purpureocillium lilacinum]|uniref:Uncharacterized protein n=1 Tax=Purpureocillium lilacinum TaxID=33203 RepID=A0ACC4E222_PURLI
MIRDPFNIHGRNALKANVFRAAQNVKEKAAQVGASALDMSFSIPNNVPNFAAPHRDLEDRAWAAVARRGASGGGILSDVQGKVAGYFEQDELPMYKDKPYGYAPSMRRRRWWRRKRVLSSIALGILGLLWLTELLLPRQKAEIDVRMHVVEAFELSWDAYERYAWGMIRRVPSLSKGGKNMAPKGLGWIIVDSLDTLILMNQTTRLHRAREWVSKSLTWDQDQDVNTFETTIRMLGGLLSAHYLSTEFPNMAPLKDDDPGMPGEDLYLEKARDLGDRLLAAFESGSGVPYASVNLAKYQGIPSHADMGASSTAEATSVQLEFKYLAKLTGEKHFWDKAEKVMEIIDDNNPKDGLVPIYIYATSGEFRGENIRLGSRGDSYYEYLIKQYLQTNKQEPVYEEMWKESLEGMDHLVCFMPGTIALAATGGLTEAEARKLPTWGKKQEADMKLARELTQTCWESAHHDPPSTFDPDPQANWRNDFNVKSNDVHNLQRPETVESLFYMWRITKDERYREWGWEMFRSFMNYTAVEDGGGFTSLNNANVIPPVIKDNMESFWLAETLKYLYLLFSPDDVLPLDKMVLNTEAHPLPRFDMGGLFSTGWKRKPRGPDGKIIGGQTEAKPTSH